MKFCQFLRLFSGGLIFLLAFQFFSPNFSPLKVEAQDANGEIEQAIYTHQEFFGSEAIVPIPTATARENLLRLHKNAPENPQVLEKLAEFNEKLWRFDEAENDLKRLAEIDSAKMENLAQFYERRARFSDEAQTLKKILLTNAAEKRAATFGRLINLARKHDLKEYLQTNFYAEIAKENADFYPIFEQLIDSLTEDENYSEALNFTRQAKIQFPEQRSVLLEKEITLLLAIDNAAEAEKVYQSAFDPFWAETEAQKFYDFLNNQDRLRAYGAEIRARFKKNPADFDAAIRLALYQNHDYFYGNDDITPTILRLEQAKKSWTTEELVTVSRLLIKAGEADLASRFLYTLYAREDFNKNSELRAKILYQLFEMFSDAGNQRLPIGKGDLRFYEDVAKADTNPGIATGILSLIFSDTNPSARLDEQEMKAQKLFNRAAAYRIFEEYKSENPDSNELAQMYLDLVRLYTATKDAEIAGKILNEFAEKYPNSKDFPAAASKLADAYVAASQEEKARKIYQKTLDYLGKQNVPLAPRKSGETNYAEPSTRNELITATTRNEGIEIPVEDEKPKPSYYYEERATFRDFLSRQTDEITYQEILEKHVASFAKEKKTAEILELYSNEIGKYPDAEWLYEQRLAWLEQTNLTADQLEIYKTALARFQTKSWRDKLARFFVRNKRDDEFAEFSEDLIGKLNDTDTQNYLAEFARSETAVSDFEKRLYLKLYQSAHRRFPHNQAFTDGLLRFYKANKQEDKWRTLAAEYYFESASIRAVFLDDLAQKNQLRDYLKQSSESENTIYELFRADASARLSDFENAIAAYRKLNEIYPNTPEFSARLINFTRSFGQKNREFLSEAANVANAVSDFQPNSTENRTRGGEIYAELGQYEKARGQWEKLIETASGEKKIYLETATLYWDYFQYDEALKTIENLREKFGDDTLYAFESGAILEAQHKKGEAIGEYVKAFDANRDDTQREKAIKQLTRLSARSEETEKIINQAFLRESARRKDSLFLSLGYAEFLIENKQIEPAENVLNHAVGQSTDIKFLEAAKDFCQARGISESEQIALQKLAAVEKSPRRTIAYRLQLADSFVESDKPQSAKTVLENLVRQFPTNYGVLTETSDFYQRIGFENESARVLENALPKSRGEFRSQLSGKLAKRLIQLNKLDSAERILLNLHNEDKPNVEIFGELARVYVRTNKSDALRKAFDETVSELKKANADPRETETEIAELRGRMIDAFTKLQDYKSAVEQHIEIINREPENEELTENAIKYVQRYGGAETLINYYEKTAAEAFKNYRWNVVLARIYEANKDLESAVKNYRAAVVNQPEMSELYLAIADLETRRGNYDEALKNIDEVLEISDEETEYLKKKIEILKRAGRFSEAEAEKAKLPAEEQPKITVNQFAEAQKLQFAEKEKARAIYREAFGKLLENPLDGEFRAADISAYAQSLREEESLAAINQRFWNLREKLVEIADENDSTGAGEARSRLTILDGAITESIGTTAKNFGTDDELKNLHEDLRRRIEETSLQADAHQTVSLVQDISRRAGFGNLEELVLLKKVEANSSTSETQIHLRNLINFYNERGAYQKIFDALEKYGSDDLSLKADAAKLVGNREKEIESLRAIYWKSYDKSSVSEDSNVARYLEILHDENVAELKSLTEKNSVYQLQLINFLIGKNEAELAHAAIENSNFSAAWKVSRHAETSLALREFSEISECYFCDALQFNSIGEMVKQSPDKQRFLINDDWFRLTREYGEWLFEKKDRNNLPSKFLTAMIENQPRNVAEQSKLGEYYLAKGDLKSAVEHLRLAVEGDGSFAENEKENSATLGAAYFKIGRADYAEELWTRALADETIDSGATFFQVLQKYGLSELARAKLSPIIVKFLENHNAENSEDFQKLIRAVAASFDDETGKSKYFQAILQQRATDVSLAAMLVNENLISRNEQKFFYESLINRSDDLDDSDYSFKAVAARTWAKEDAETIYEQEENFKTEEPENKKYEWQKKYLYLLVELRDNAKADEIVREIEKEINNRYARPAWLQAAKIRLNVRHGKFDLNDAERFIGIKISNSATEIVAPSVERFNDVSRILNEENLAADALRLSEDYFARTLALEQYNQTNFVGLARTYFRKNETEKASQILRLMIDASDADKREPALAEIAKIEAVKNLSADAAKMSAPENNFAVVADSLRIAAEISFGFQQINFAIKLRRSLLEVSPADSFNKIELAKMLAAIGEKAESEILLTQIADDKSAFRAVRWQARQLLNLENPNANFDSFSQFYNGTAAMNSKEYAAANEFFIDSLVADKTQTTSAAQELVKVYAAVGKPFAALRLAEIDQSTKSDELLETLSKTAESVGDFERAIKFETGKSAPNAERITELKRLEAVKNQRATDFRVDLEVTRKL